MNVQKIKATVRLRDGHRCTECGMTHQEHVAKYGKGLEVHRVTPGSKYTVEGCVTLCRSCHGPKPKSPWGSSPWRNFRLPGDLYFMVKLVAATQGITAARYIDRALRASADHDLPRAAKIAQDRANATKGKTARTADPKGS